MRIQRILVSLFIVFSLTFSQYSLNADSFTFSTEIDGVSGYSDFGWEGNFPVGTTFSYYNYFNTVSKKLPTKAFIETSMSFSDRYIDSSYDYLTGEPVWINTYKKAQNLNRNGSKYFNPRAYIEAWLEQGFLKNPVSGNNPLFEVRIGFNSRYSMALEKINSTDYVFVNSDGSDKAPFGTDSSLPAFPWLEGNRKALNNYLFVNTYWYLRRYVAYDLYEGLYGELDFQYGPDWLANTLYPGGVQSNFYRAYGYLEEKLTLFSIMQEGNRTWSYLYIGHSNSISYTGGDVVPLNKLPGDRLRWNASDSIWLRLSGPQFIASDCYSYFEIGLNNSLFFGNVVNEVSQETTAIELQSSISAKFHLRLFGFVRFEYNLGYNMFRGIWDATPNWWQNAYLQFYVSI